MQRIVSTSAGETLTIEVERGGTRVTLKAVPALKEVKDSFGNVHRIGVLGISRSIAPDDVKFEPVGPLHGGRPRRQGDLVRHRAHAVLYRRRRRPAGRRPTSSAARSGSRRSPGRWRRAGLPALMHLAAVLSVSIGLLNLFPVPLLDGGHLLFYAIEAVRGRPLSERAQEIGFRIGFAIVVMLMIFATYNDILHLAAQLDGVVGEARSGTKRRSGRRRWLHDRTKAR